MTVEVVRNPEEPKEMHQEDERDSRLACSRCGHGLSQNPDSEDQVSGLCAYCLNGPFIAPHYNMPIGFCEHAERTAYCERKHR